jgi:hypothetical protein
MAGFMESVFFNNPDGVGFICSRKTLKRGVVDVLLIVTALKNTAMVMVY